MLTILKWLYEKKRVSSITKLYSEANLWVYIQTSDWKKDSQKILNATLRLNSVCFQTYKENGLSNVSKLCYEAKISPFFLDIPIKKWFLRYLKIDFEDNSRHFQMSYV